MKPTLAYALFLLFTLATQSILFTTTRTAAAAGDFIIDATGNKVLNNVYYHFGPASGKGGAFKLTDHSMNNNKICPYNVVQDPADNLGGQFQFSLLANGKYVNTTQTLFISSFFRQTGPCIKSTFWTIPDGEAKAPSNLVTTGGSIEEGMTCFKVAPYPKPTNPKVKSYMIQHCPSFCGNGPQICFNMSLYSYKGERRLATVGTPFEFVFHKLT